MNVSWPPPWVLWILAGFALAIASVYVTWRAGQTRKAMWMAGGFGVFFCYQLGIVLLSRAGRLWGGTTNSIGTGRKRRS